MNFGKNTEITGQILFCGTETKSPWTVKCLDEKSHWTVELKAKKCQWTVKCLDEKSHRTVDLKRKKVSAPYASAPVTYHGKLGSGPYRKHLSLVNKNHMHSPPM